MNKMMIRNFILKREFNSSKILQAGHSKWANIKHKKAANDAVKAANTFRLSKQIQMYAKIGGGDLSQNIMLVNAIEKAKQLSVPKKVIESAIKRGTGELKSNEKVETVVYEGLAPGGVAVIIEAITDNKNRSMGFIRPVFNKFNLNMTPTGYMFERRGVLICSSSGGSDKNIDDIMEEILEIDGIIDINEIGEDNLIEIITEFEETGKVGNLLKDKYEIKEMNIGYIPNEDMMVEITNEDTMVSYEKFMGLLDEVEDITQVFTNLKE